MNTYKLLISSPEEYIFDGQAAALNLRGADGDLAILAGHTPFITSVVPCDCSIVLEDGSEKKAKTEGGLLCVTNKDVTLLSSSFCWDE